MVYEYSVVPAPKKGVKAKGAKTPEDRFAHALQEIMNEKGAEGWDYIRTDTLPAIERSGLTGRTTTYQNMMVFRRALNAAVAETDPPRALLAAPVAQVEEDSVSEPTFASRSEDRMMDVKAAAADEDILRAEPQLRADRTD